jgi:hypothetical protein
VATNGQRPRDATTPGARRSEITTPHWARYGTSGVLSHGAGVTQTAQFGLDRDLSELGRRST